MQDRNKLLKQATIVGVAGNAGLCVLKLTAGVLAGSGAMISDAVNSASDVLSTGIACIGAKMAGKAADPEHPYGHERFESVASILLSVMVFATGLMIGWNAIQQILHAETLTAPGVLALVGAALSVLVKELMYRYTISASKKLHSVALKASAWDHRSDAISSAGTFAGVLGARLGVPVLDPIASIVICLFILKVAVDIFREAVSETVDRSCSPEVTAKIRDAITKQTGVVRVDVLQTRRVGASIYVDTEIAVDGSVPLTEAHDVAERVHDAVESEEPAVRHCMVHVNPAAEPEAV